MAENKTKQTQASVDAYLSSRASGDRLADCQTLMQMLSRVTNEPPKMWGPSIVGYGRYTYRYDSGRTGEMCAVGFAVRGKELVLYLMLEAPAQAQLLARLGKHKTGKSCLYVKQLADLDGAVLEALVVGSLAEIERQYGSNRGAG
jgi:hypothetical protein